MLRRIRSWLRDWLFRRRLDRELDEEIGFHLERAVEEHIAAGCSHQEAHRRARAEFGAIDAIREEVRETRATRLLDSAWLDLRFGARSLRRSPLFALTAVATLALTIAAVTTLLTVANAFLRRPLPVRDPDRIVEVRATRDDGATRGFVSYPDYLRFRDGAETLEGLAAAYVSAPLFVAEGDEASILSGAVVTANFFPLLGLEPAAGRFFHEGEDEVPGRDAVVVLAYDFWSSRFGADPAAIGAELRINDLPFTVIGVAPRAFHGIGTSAPQVYLPAMMLPVGYRWCAVLDDPDCTILRMFGRLADGAGIDAARAEVASLMPERWRRAAPGANAGVAVEALRGTDLTDTTQSFLDLLAAICGALLIVCCANLAGLLASRTGARARELAVRTALGAPRSRLLRQMLTESCLLAVTGGALGIALSVALTRVLGTRFYATDGAGRPYHVDLSLEPAVVAAVLLLALLCGLAFGAFPALIAVRRGGAGNLARGARGAAAEGRARRWLLGAQAAAAVAFVVVGALLASSATLVLGGVNFDPEGVALMRLRPRLLDYEPERAQQFLRRVVERLDALPEVESVTMVGTGVALGGLSAAVGLPEAERPLLGAGYIEVGPRYFETLRTPLLRGREFDEQDDVSANPVAVVNQALATRLWPAGDALGADLLVDDTRRTVVGVVADVPLHHRDEAERPYVYTPFWQNPAQVDARLQVRVTADAAAMLPRLTAEAHQADPAVPIAETMTLTQQIEGLVRPQRMAASAVGYAAVLAVALAALGLYASQAAGVTSRTHEIGVRLAVGARAADIFAMIVAQGAAVLAAGGLAGLALAAASARLLQHLLYGSAEGDAVLFALAALVVCVAGIAAILVPAARAARIEPLVAMRPR